MKAPLLISESAIKIHYGPFRFLYLVFSLLPPPLSLLSFFISSLFNAYFFDTYLEAEGNEATLKAKLFLDMIFFKFFAFVFRSIKIKLAEIFVIKRLTLFIYFFSRNILFPRPFLPPLYWHSLQENLRSSLQSANPSLSRRKFEHYKNRLSWGRERYFRSAAGS